MWVDDMDTAKEPELWKIRQKAGMVFQNPDNQIIGTVVEEDVGFGPENMGVPTEKIWKRVDDSLKKDRNDRLPLCISEQAVRRTEAKSCHSWRCAMRPSCIVLDEPTAMLDPNGRREVLEAVSELNQKENVTVILITHYGRGHSCQQGLCNGPWKCCDAGNSKGNLFPGGDPEEIPTGCTAGNFACPRAS